ncbi:PLP-dependent aminotransferase family protein [Ochrobactrum sp. AN78]|uniref:MocR-like pyridoxine biosynthesis transcription factor PdxR n=1 Tax=Ochrobactrum sp. AN78 TaxID=3039853 RepID=UPI002989DA23|nr:PLP-dependent aminotransferase family protein [Ochrobactrum sp. AN78]MDH7792511.1 GntR family transcriptional regulator/MocR family aminotransferase [Ochrobactrum sp. AN78]
MFKHSQLESVKAWLSHPTHASMPLHARIQRAIRQLIVDGRLKRGKPLPASRSLSQSLGVSRDTVEAAYAQLHAEGFIERRVGSGSFVAQTPELKSRQPRSRPHSTFPPSSELSQRGDALYKLGGVTEIEAPRPFAPGVPDVRSFPLRIWERLHRQVIKELGAGALCHADPQGVKPLRQAIADYLNLERGARTTADQLLILTSSQQALTLSATMLFDPGERIYIENPVYQGARKAFDAAGLIPVPVPVDQQGMALAPIISDPKPGRGVFVTPSHQFPTGTTLPLDRRLQLIEWARRHDAFILEDDYDSEFHYDGKPTACLQGLDTHDRTLYIGTFTKSLFPGLRIGYVVLPQSLVKPMTAARTLLDGHSASIAQHTLARFIEGGHFGIHIRSMRRIYAQRLQALKQLVHKHLSEFVTPQVPAGGLQMPCLLIGNLCEKTVVEAAARIDIELVGLSSLHAGTTDQKGFLIGFAAYTPSELEAAIQKLAALFQSLTNNPRESMAGNPAGAFAPLRVHRAKDQRQDSGCDNKDAE